MQRKLLVISYGCQMNEYDSAKIVDILAASHDFVVTDKPEQADLIILNTCSIRAKAEEKIFSELGRLRSLKKKNKNLILVVGGCVAVQEQKNIFRRAPYVDIIFGPQTLHRLPEMYQKALKKERRIIDITFPQIEKFDYFPKPHAETATAYVSIMEGCNKFCSYCIVPYTRGREVNRPMQDILTEINILANQGVKEIHLLGQNVNAYTDKNKKANFADLLCTIANIDAIKRIRFTTSHPREFGNDLIEVFAKEPKLANHLHLPVQSGSNNILKLMRRGYTREEYLAIIENLRQIRPNISVSTDIIVGFPNETDEDFAGTMDLVKKINFDTSYSFIYSKRPKTPAAMLNDNVSLAEKKQRLLILQTQLLSQARKYSQEMIGTTQDIIVTSTAKKDPNQFSGRTENNRVVNFTAKENVLGAFVAVKITKALTNSLLGEMVTNSF